MTKWTQNYFSDYLSDIGGLFASLMAGASLALGSYQSFVAHKSILKRLYGEEDLYASARRTLNAKQISEPESKEILRAKIEKRKDFNARFCSYTIISFAKAICCCFAPCCRTGKCRRLLDSHKKFEIAKERLKTECDIQNMIEMNRVTRLLHKARF